MSTQRPNILLLITDQQSHHMMSCAGNSYLTTPAIDSLAERGTRISRSYCSNPVCMPSRFSMFTGRMPTEVNLRYNQNKDTIALPDAELPHTLGHLLRDAGYACYYGGKQHIPAKLNAERIGFEYFSNDECMALAEESARIIQQDHEQPWFVVSSLINPHDICYQAIRSFATMEFDRGLVERGKREIAALDKALQLPEGVTEEEFFETYCPPLPDNFEVQSDEPSMIHDLIAERDFRLGAREQWTERDWRLHRWAYHRLTETVDREIGVILDALEASGQLDNTLVLFTSDHGDHSASHRLEHKTVFYDEAARVPLIAQLPGQIPAGVVNETDYANTGLDLLPTICDYAGVTVPEHCRGASLRPVLEDAQAVRDGVYAENQISYMWVSGDYKYVEYDRGENRIQLYDMKNDPGETRNEAAEHPEIVAAFQERLHQEQRAHAAAGFVEAAATS